jgi:DNA-binding XRE family transcriptional regulator
MVKLSKAEKAEMCAELTQHLPKLRKLLNLTQEELGSMSGLSRVTISQIEGGKVKMNWLHLNAILCICQMNIRTIEYFYANKLLGPKFLLYMQRKEDAEYPDINIFVCTGKLRKAQEFVSNNNHMISK